MLFDAGTFCKLNYFSAVRRDMMDEPELSWFSAKIWADGARRLSPGTMDHST
jgi:hypothetical protein